MQVQHRTLQPTEDGTRVHTSEDEADKSSKAARSRPKRPQLVLLALLLLVVLLLLASATIPEKIFGERETVIVVGAGAAGLAAAVALRSVATVVVLEAQDRIGGRVHTNHSLGVPVEVRKTQRA